MMNDGSRHDRGRAPESESIPEVGDRPGWLARAGSRVRRAWRWVRRKHEPISEGIETAGRGWARAARTAARIGRSLHEMGTVIERNGAALAKGRGRARGAAATAEGRDETCRRDSTQEAFGVFSGPRLVGRAGTCVSPGVEGDQVDTGPFREQGPGLPVREASETVRVD